MLRASVLLLLLVAPALHAAAPAPAPKPSACGDQSRLAPEKRLSNTVKWATASEEDTFGYDVYRGDREEGPFVRVTHKPILGAGTTDETHKYQFVDDSADPCVDHWYYVEEITTSGVREKFTPVFRRPARLKPDGTALPAAPAAKPETH